MASTEQLRKVALYCREYDPWREAALTMTARAYEDKYENCINCSHYTREARCDLDLIDSILSSMAMELDLKS